MLTPGAAIAYLRRQQLLDDDQIVERGLRVTDVSRRNRTLLVEVGDGGFALKQGRGGETRVAHEAAILRRLAPVEDVAGLLPRVARYDPRARVLALHLESDATTLYDAIMRAGRAEPAQAALLGDALGRLHASGSAGDAAGAIERAPPTVLEIHRPTGRTWRQSSPADRELLRIVQATAGFGDALDGLRAAWEPRALIHNDVRWSNCLLPAAVRGERARLVLIDWEGAQLGDPGWDVGSALAEYLACWLRSIPFTGAGTPDQSIHLAGFPLEQLQPSMRALWGAWATHTHLSDAALAAHLQLTTRYAAARLVQNAWEYTRTAETLPPGVALLLQVAFNMLAHPGEAARRLLGLDAGSPAGWA